MHENENGDDDDQAHDACVVSIFSFLEDNYLI